MLGKQPQVSEINMAPAKTTALLMVEIEVPIRVEDFLLVNQNRLCS